jgi:uncharacterized protein YchJ
MRSRFSAFALATQEPQALEHLVRTHHHGDQPAAAQRKALRTSFRTIQWLSLTVLDRQHGTQDDQYGTVTFEARWRDRDRREGVLRECSRFGRGAAGEWLYLQALSLDEGPAG